MGCSFVILKAVIQLHQQLEPKDKAAVKITASLSLVNGNSPVCFYVSSTFFF